MQATLEVLAGPAAGRRVRIESGHLAQVGRLAEADLIVQHDPEMSSLHFQVECAEDSCRLKDLNSRFGTFLNRVRVTEAVLKNGDQITAGRTVFVVRLWWGAPPSTLSPGPADAVATAVVRASPAAAAPPPEADKKRVLEVLRQQPGPLFAVLDAARDPKVLELLQPSPEQHQSLFEGPQGETLALWAPYLVALPPESAFLETLVDQGWSKAWGVYLTCPFPFEDVRKHLRHFLTVRDDDGDDLLFRFYDPRVLRAFLPVCTPEETRTFFGPIQAFLLEARNKKELLKFTAPAGDVQTIEV